MSIALASIPTSYRGIQMRSRLEARWAAMFDLLGWEWEYEPFDLPGWIPDFAIYRMQKGKPRGPFGMAMPEVVRNDPILVEVKPYAPDDAKLWAPVAKKVHSAMGDRYLSEALLLGQSTIEFRGFMVHVGGIVTSVWDEKIFPAICVMVDRYGWPAADLYATSDGASLSGGYIYDGNGPRVSEINLSGHTAFSELWNEAGNRSQWKGARATP